MTTVQILCDNNIGRMDFLGEHGFAALIEHDDKTYLFDTGQGHTLPHNVKSGGFKLGDIEAILLSHGHFDHTGGLPWVLEQTGAKKIIAHPAVFAKHMARLSPDPAVAPLYIGPPQTQEAFEAAGAIFDFREETGAVAPGFHFITGYARQPEQTPGDRQLVLPQGEDHVPDPIAEDANLLLETPSGPVLVLGCAHGGVLNILDHVKATFGISRLHAILGGTHLMFYAPEQIRAAIEAFEAFDVKVVGVSHCTGPQAAMTLAQHFGDRFQQAAAGSQFVF
ncbi:MAG: MBL fold metallo-hydrolase [Deltaproteobacteria bacterium]|nr:MBL fold metallo-hydrolase [Deltaproteobacteria bacterium]